MNVLIAPDKFRDALDAAEAADALAAGVRDAEADADIVICPLGDGGEGTGCVLAQSLAAIEQTATALDPLGRPRPARWWHSPDGKLAIIEMAEASGLAQLDPSERNALRTSTHGTGQLLAAAIDAGCERVLLCVGGSATVDGGAGCLQALGVSLLDHDGRAIEEPVGGGMLARVGSVRPSSSSPLAIDILCDVDNPLLGPRGAAPVFAPQKGADAEGVRTLEQNLAHWRDVLGAAFGSVPELPGTGAAGGLPFGLLVAFGARLLPGLQVVAEHVSLRQKLDACDLCLTGEGRLDAQTVGGKVVSGVAQLAAEAGVPAVAFVGAVATDAEPASLAATLGLKHIEVITPPNTPLPQALAETADNLRRAAFEVVRTRH